MWMLYALALFPVAIGAYFWITSHKVVWWEWLVGSAVGFLIAGLVHLTAAYAVTHDTETWSGRVVSARFRPYWHASWWETETYTDGKGRSHTRTVRRTRSYPNAWYARVSFSPNLRDWTEYNISEGWYKSILDEFGTGQVKLSAARPHWDHGSTHDWISGENKSGVILPANEHFSFTNRTLAAKSLFSYAKVPPGTPVLEYPGNSRWSISDRLLGTAKNAINIRDWDVLNAKLGPTKHVNLILVGFEGSDASIGQHQEAAWKGGKKNDLVLCYGGRDSDNTPSWAYVFGWTEQAIVKRNLETILISNEINIEILPKIAEEVQKNYIIKDWSKFDYIPIEPPWWAFLLMIVLMTASTTGFWWWAHTNDEDKPKNFSDSSKPRSFKYPGSGSRPVRPRYRYR